MSTNARLFNASVREQAEKKEHRTNMEICMKHVPNRFPITRKMVPVFNLIQKYKRKLNKARKHIYFYRLVLKTTLPDFAFSIVPLVLIDGCEGSENSLHIQDEYNIFFGNEYTSFSEGIYLPEKRYILFRQKHYTFQAKTLYFSGKRYILFSQKVYTFLVKSIYCFSERNNALVYI